MKAFLVPETGEVLYPVRVEVGSGMGDALALADAASDEARRWTATLLLQPMPERMRPLLEQLRAAKQG